MIEKTILELPISRENAYELKKLKKGERIPLVSDIMFHTMLNNESRKKYVSYLLSLLIHKNQKEIEENITFIKNKLDKENYYTSNKTVDFVCKVKDKIYNIEMNNNTDYTTLERNIAYILELYKSKMKIGTDYHYQNVLQININNFSFKGKDNSIEIYKLKNENGEILTNKITIIFIYLPKIREKYYNKEKLSELEKLLLVFNEEDSKELKNIMGDNQIMNEYRKESLEASEDEEIIGLYDRALHLEMLHHTEITHARENGFKEGEKKAKLDAAKNFFKNGVTKEVIMKSTGLTEKELKELKELNE